MEPIYVLFIKYDHSKCSNKIPNSIQYFQRLLDNMCPSRFVSRRIDKHKTIYYYFDNIADIFTFTRKIETIVNNPTIKVINRKFKSKRYK